MRRQFVLFAIFAGSLSAAEWTPELSMKVRTIGDVTPSPDGQLIVWTETAQILDTEKSESNAQLFLAHSDGSHRLQLTHGEKSANSPEFSPDGRFVFFASERTSATSPPTGPSSSPSSNGAPGKRNVFRIAVDGGEAEKITEWTGSLPTYHVSPDGKWIAFSGAPERPEIEQAKKLKLDFRVIDENPADLALFVLPVEANAEGKRPLRRIANGPFSVGAFTWSPDSRLIAFETRPTPDADDARKTDILEVAVEAATLRTIAATNATEFQPQYSPDGRYLAFVRSANPPSGVFANHIILQNRADSKDRQLPDTLVGLPNLIGWAADSKSMFFVEWKGTRQALYSMPVDGPPTSAFVPHGTFNQIRLNASHTHAGVALQSSSDPPEAFAMELSSMHPVQVSAANTDLAKPPLGETKVIQWKAKDGKEVEGLLTLPVGYQSGKKYPLILNIHGGPSGAFGETFIGAAGLYPIATFAARGYVVLRPNPRGSVGYGGAFRAANVNDWGGGDYQDLMSGVDALIAQGIADPNRLAVMGWSYGGFMTNWVISQTQRFKAAATGAGLSDLISMWGTNDIPTTLDDYFSGAPWEETERYVKMSPLYYAKNITTPTLILHGEIDPRVPTSQGYEMYHTLKRRGVETTMVVYPRTQHGPQEPKFILDIMQRHLDWVSKHL